jgi:hypothetical protein
MVEKPLEMSRYTSRRRGRSALDLDAPEVRGDVAAVVGPREHEIAGAGGNRVEDEIRIGGDTAGCSLTRNTSPSL